MSAAAVPAGLATWIGVVQFFFVTTWTLYVIYLPALCNQAGIAVSWVPWILVADQVMFAVMDVLTGFWVDRVRSGLARLGGRILALTVLSCAAFLLLPFVTAFSASTSTSLLLGLLVVWALSSSALRSPPWALLSRYAAKPDVPWLSTLVLTGTAIASALAPYLGIALKGVDPRIPFAVSTLTLLAAVAGLVVIERRLAGAPSAPAGETEPPFDAGAPGAGRLMTLFFLALLFTALGFQSHFALNSAPQYLRHATQAELPWLMPVFWIGFNLLMFPAARLVKRLGAIPMMAAGAAAGAVASLGAVLAPSLALLVAAQFAAGGCWGAICVGAYTAAVGFGRRGREGALLGTLFAVLAAATFARIAAMASGWVLVPAFKAALPWIPLVCWALAAALAVFAVASAGRVMIQSTGKQ